MHFIDCNGILVVIYTEGQTYKKGDTGSQSNVKVPIFLNELSD